ncbi:MAG: hypothetical protein CL846_01400 [Crocinitomicaceae bacterium]|nr:hypothetical protein [Crocinitomicaceae bacterium]
MKNKVFIFISFWFSIFSSVGYSQFNNDFGFSIGPSNYLGEIGGIGHKPSRGFIGDLKLKQTALSGGVFLRNKITPNLSLNTSLNYTRIGGDDIYTESGPRFWRNLRFRNDIIEISPRFELTLKDIADVGRTGRYRTKLKLYAHLGITAFYHNPKGRLTNSTNWIPLRGLQTEGVNYNRLGIGIPMGGGLILTHNHYYRFGLVVNYTKTFTDYLDDVSTFYYGHSNGSQSALYANQTLGVSSGGSAPDDQLANFIPGSIRGNPEDKDSYITVCLTYSKYFLSRNKYYRGRTKRYNRNSFKKPKYRVNRAKF